MPFKCKHCDQWYYSQEELEAGSPGGIAPAPDSDESEKPKKKKK